MLNRPDEIRNIEYWSYRLDEAEKAGNLQYAVYLCNRNAWDIIWEKHKAILAKEIPTDAKVLDAGSGLGRVSELFDNYIGVDFAPAFIEKAKILYPSKTFMVARLDKLPFEDKFFDWAICISIKHMVIGKASKEEWQEMEKEIKRVAKKILILEYSAEEYEIL